MLTKLTISNYALIDRLEVDFKKGLTIITGETGAGKSIIMGALSLILGERADSKSVRDKSKKSVVEATFDISKFDLQHFFESNDLEYFAEECILRKEFSDSGRSRAFVNDTPVSLTLMRELTNNLIDIHSQHSNMLVSKPAYQLGILDSLAGNKALLEDYALKYKHYKEISAELERAKKDFSRNKEEEDYLRFQLTQLQELKLEKGEDEVLEALQKKLTNVTEIKENLWQAQMLLDGEENSILDNLKTSAKSVSAAAQNMAEAEELAARLDSAVIELKDVAMAVAALQEDLEFNPDELERVNDRLNAIYSLETKHSVKCSDDLMQLQTEYEQRLSEIDNSEDNIKRLETEETKAFAAAKLSADLLSESRKKVAAEFAKQLKLTALPLGLNNIEFKVLFEHQDLARNGADAVRYMVAFNKNQELMPVEMTASGGELSRLMLSIKTIVAKSMNLPTIIFDEVDTGVSGEVAEKIGSMMAELSKHIQVLAITHLPQVAAQGDNHYKVYKTDVDDSTVTSIKVLDSEARIHELAAMLSGSSISQSAIENAKTLLKHKITG